MPSTPSTESMKSMKSAELLDKTASREDYSQDYSGPEYSKDY
jgi:hypothetical protein